MPPGVKKPQQPVNITLVLIGNAFVGKTSLLCRFLDKGWSPTDGAVNATIIDFKVHNMEVNGRRVKLSIWDTAGMEKFRTMTTRYYRGCQGVIVVYDVTSRETFDSLRSWYSDLDKHLSAPVVKIIVGNKVDQKRQVSTAEGAAYAKETNSLFIESSVKTGVGVDETFRKLVQKILEIPEIWDRNVGGNPGAPETNSEGDRVSMPKGVKIVEDHNTANNEQGCSC